MSDYLGVRDRRYRNPEEREFVSKAKFDKDIIPGGPMTHEYEDFVKNIFRGGPIPKEDELVLGIPKLSAETMNRMEHHFGKDALDDSNDYNILQQSPLSSLYSELGLSDYDPDKKVSTYQQYPVYNPKSSSEYFSTLLSSSHAGEPSSPKSRTFREQFDDEWKKSNRQHLVDYKDFDRAPLSPYMYQGHNYIQRQDSRIVGSNFVQVTTRPRDNFLDKVDKLLADVRAMPRY